MRQQLGDDYAWPGDVRELEQCRATCCCGMPITRAAALRALPASRRAELAEAVRRCTLDAGELLRRYTTLVYLDERRNLEDTARRLDLERRIVKRHVDAAFAARLPH